VAARIRRQLGVEVRQIAGHYGEFTVLVGDDPLISAGPMGWMGVLPPTAEVVQAIKAAIGAAPPVRSPNAPK
jgi:hypothetical protein